MHHLMHELPAYEHASVTFDADPGHVILDHVSMCLPVGEMIVITGPSGIGKSTLADVIAGLQFCYKT
jgi:ABC-type nitrate/sulfonate/bicarbonate transport system ATPase subunit